MSQKKIELRDVFNGGFLTLIEKARYEALDVLMSCIKSEYASEIKNFCYHTEYQAINAIATTIYPISFLNGRRTVRGRNPVTGREEVSESGSMSLMVVGSTGSGKTTFLAKRVHNIMEHELNLDEDKKIELKKSQVRLDALYRKHGETQLTQEEHAEIERLEAFIKKQAPFFYSYSTPQKMLKSIADAEMAAVIEDEGESLVKNLLSAKNNNGLDFGSMVNRLLDGVPTRYDTKSNPYGDRMKKFAFSIYCSVQPDYFRKMDASGDITNKLGRFNVLLISETEWYSVSMMGRDVLPDLSMPRIDELIKDVYRERKVRETKGSEIKVDISPFLKVYTANLEFWAKIAKPKTAAQRILELIQKHRKRWAEYARGLEPICKDERSLSIAIAAFLLLMILNITQYYVAENTSREATNLSFTLENFLKENGLFDLIYTALANKREGVGDGILSRHHIGKDYRKKTNSSSERAVGNIINLLIEKGIIHKVAWGKYEVLDYADNIPQLCLIDFDFGGKALKT